MSTKITKIGITNDKVSARGGLPIFLRYIEKIGFYRLISGTILSMVLTRSKRMICTNFGNCPRADERLRASGGNEWFEAETIVRKSHQRGADELIHCSIKELATKEQLSFKSFGMKRAYYIMQVFTHSIFESCKRDVTAQVIPITVYPNTFQRKLLDFAAKITSRARNIVLNDTEIVCETINIELLWIISSS